jgi:hypothetical protein
MNKKLINKDKMLDMFYQYMSESNDGRIFSTRISKGESFPTVSFGIHAGEYRFYADRKNNKLVIKSWFTRKPDNYQTHTVGANTASLLNIPRCVYDMIESQLVENNYL